MTSIDIELLFLRVSTTVVGFGVTWLLQSTVLILLGLAAARVLRRFGSATQSAVYRTTLVTVMLCPIVTLGLWCGGASGWSVKLPTSFVFERMEPQPLVETRSPSLAPLQIEHTGTVPLRGREPVERPSVASLASPAEAQAPSTPGSTQSIGRATAITQSRDLDAAKPVASAVAGPTSTPVQTVAEAWSFDIRLFGLVCLLLTAIWLLVSGVLALRLWLSHRQLPKFRQSAIPADEAVQSCCRGLATELGTAMPDVLRSPLVASPFLIGISRPAIMLPEDVSNLELRDVLVHELAHLQRCDCFWLLLHRICSAVFWFQPLLFWLARRMEATAEDVCDDYVVKHGGSRSAYANSLVEIATLSTRPIAPVGVAMVSQRSILEHRVHRIMDFSRPLSTTSGQVVLALILLGGVVGTSVAGLLMPSVGQEGQQSTSSAAGVEIAQEKSKVSITTGDWATDEQIIQGRVWSGPNTPVPDTKVYWFRSGIEELRSMQPRLVATTGSEGRFSFRMPDYKTRDTDPASWDVRDYFVFTAKGHSYALKNAAGLRAEMTGQYYKAWVGEIADGESIVQLPVATESLRGRIVDIDGQPVAGARITICNQQQVARDNSIPGPPTVDALDAIPFPRNPPQRKTDWHELLSDLFAHIEIVPRRFALPSATTNANGEFELSGVDNLLLLLAVEADGFESTEIIASVVRKAPLHIKADRQQIFRNTTIHANDFSFVMAPSNPVRGRITDLDTGQPIVDVVVRPTYVRRFSRRRTEDFAAITDKDGRYEIRGLPIKKDIEIEAFTTNDVPWVPAGTEVDTTKPGESLKADIGMKKGLWAKGRIYDATDGGPFTGSVQYFWFGGDGMRKQYPGADKVSRASRYHTNVRGEFRIPVMPTYGILTYRWDAADLGARERIDKFTRGLGADSLKRPFYNKKSRTNGFYMTATGSMIPWNFNAVRDFKPEAGAKTVRADIPMRSCKPFHMKVVMADGSKPKLAPVNQGFEASPDEDELYPEFEVHGLVEGWPRDLKKTLEYEITDMADEATRKVFVYHEKEDLAGGAFVSQETPQPALIRLMPAASISGRLVDEDGEPITEAFLYNSVAYNRVADAGLWADHPGRISGPNQIPVDKEGRFHIGGLLQGWTYSASVMTERRGEQMRRTLGTAFEKITVETGQQLDLGDVKLKPQRR